MDQTVDIINRVLPILFLIGLGNWIRRSQFVADSTVDDLRKIVVNMALPSVLFFSFLQMELKSAYIVIFIVIFLLCAVLMWFGFTLQRRTQNEVEYYPFLITGFEYGMLGVSLFASAYGLENLGYIAVIDLGHELFIWFVFLSFLLMRRDGVQAPAQLVGSFLTSPVIIGILAGIAFNLLGAEEFLFDTILTGAVMSTGQFLNNLTIPLILIIVGHGIKLDRTGIRDALPIIAIRLVILFPLAFVLNALMIRQLLDLEEGFEAALFTLLILPPPFIIPLFMKTGIPEERRYINNALTLYTVVTIALFTVYFALNPNI